MVSDTVPSDERPMTGDITVVSVEPLEIEKETENALLDHVPVVGILVCTAYKKPFIKQDGEDTSDKTTNEKGRPESTPETTAPTAKVGSSASGVQKELFKKDGDTSEETTNEKDNSGLTPETTARSPEVGSGASGAQRTLCEDGIERKPQEEFQRTPESDGVSPRSGPSKNEKRDMRLKENRQNLDQKNIDGTPDMRFTSNKEKYGNKASAGKVTRKTQKGVSDSNVIDQEKDRPGLTLETTARTTS